MIRSSSLWVKVQRLSYTARCILTPCGLKFPGSNYTDGRGRRYISKPFIWKIWPNTLKPPKLPIILQTFLNAFLWVKTNAFWPKSPASPQFAQNVCSGADLRKHQSSASLAFVMGIHWLPVDSPHKGPVTRKMFPFDDVIMMLTKVYSFWGILKTEHNWHKNDLMNRTTNLHVIFLLHNPTETKMSVKIKSKYTFGLQNAFCFKTSQCYDKYILHNSIFAVYKHDKQGTHATFFTNRCQHSHTNSVKKIRLFHCNDLN